ATAQLVRVIVPAGGAALPASGLAGVAGMLVLTGLALLAATRRRVVTRQRSVTGQRVLKRGVA
ncbi:MAG: hypothetical protein FWC46_05405, partial [Actinomycetia bacterium]|nr:hypothetical protein [Actinomycetes bacterium]